MLRKVANVPEPVHVILEGTIDGLPVVQEEKVLGVKQQDALPVIVPVTDAVFEAEQRTKTDNIDETGGKLRRFCRARFDFLCEFFMARG